MRYCLLLSSVLLLGLTQVAQAVHVVPVVSKTNQVCDVACYSTSSRSPAGKIRVPGDYQNGKCIPAYIQVYKKGFGLAIYQANVNTITNDPMYKDFCRFGFPAACGANNCWINPNTGSLSSTAISEYSVYLRQEAAYRPKPVIKTTNGVTTITGVN